MRAAAARLVMMAALCGCENRLPPDRLEKIVQRVDVVSPSAFSDLDASVVFPASFDGDFCKLSVTPHRDGCLVNFGEPPPDAGALVLHSPELPRSTWRGEVVKCDAIFWVCQRPYRCPCPFVTREIDTIAPAGRTWVQNLLFR